MTATFNAEIASRYDADSASMFAPEVLDPTVSFLADLAGEGPALEFGIGTGRVALPLSSRGIPVSGIDLSAPMLDELRKKEGAEKIALATGDFATTRVDGDFRLVYLVFNTIMNLTTQEAQLACFQNAAAHLAPGGCFVIEVMVPELRHVPPGERVRVFRFEESRIGFDEYTDFTHQILYSHHYRMRGGELKRFSAPYRWVWPSELDLMARLAGMSLIERWAGWQRESFEDDSGSHVSVWQLSE